MEKTNKKRNKGSYLTRWNAKQASLVAVLSHREEVMFGGTQIGNGIMKGGNN